MKKECECGVALVSQQEKEDGECSLCKGEKEITGGELRKRVEKEESEKGEKPKVKKMKKVILINCDSYPELYEEILKDAKKNFRNVGMQALLALAEKYKVNLIKEE